MALFLTWRYGSSAATNAFQDFRGLRNVLAQGAPEADVPLFNEVDFPYPATFDDLQQLRWPKARPIVARGTLAVTLKAGALDIADGSPASRSNLPNREYHHLFPQHLLSKDGKMGGSEIFRALNCVLITWNTNRNISAKDPLTYLKERTKRSRLGEELGEQAVRTRLASHLVPYDALAVGGYGEIADAEERSSVIQSDYRRFLEARADLVLPPIRTLCEGAVWPAV